MGKLIWAEKVKAQRLIFPADVGVLHQHRTELNQSPLSLAFFTSDE
jgi:hypothetical protein